MHHIAPGTSKWYWVLYNIPANVTSLPKNVKGVGTSGQQQRESRLGYAPPHSKGPGEKKYTLHGLRPLGAPKINVPAEEVNRDVLLAAMKDSILATAELNVVYHAATSGDRRSSSRQLTRHAGTDARSPAADGDDTPPRRAASRGNPRPRPADNSTEATASAAARQTRVRFRAGTLSGCSRTIRRPAPAIRSSPPSTTR